VQHFGLGDASREDDGIHGELLDPEMGVEEVEGKDEPGRQQRLVGVNDHGDIDNPAWHEFGKEQGEPHDQAGGPDHGNAPEDGEVVELLPIGPAVELRAGSLAEKPFLVRDKLAPVIQIRNHGIGAKNNGQELLDGGPSGYWIQQVAPSPPAGPDTVRQVQGEIQERDDRSKMME